jgi:hypothetical protein
VARAAGTSQALRIIMALPTTSVRWMQRHEVAITADRSVSGRFWP